MLRIKRRRLQNRIAQEVLLDLMEELLNYLSHQKTTVLRNQQVSKKESMIGSVSRLAFKIDVRYSVGNELESYKTLCIA